MLVLSNAIHISQYLKWCLENHTHEYYTWVKAIPASYRKHRVWLRTIDTDVTACILQNKEKNPKKIVFLKNLPPVYYFMCTRDSNTQKACQFMRWANRKVQPTRGACLEILKMTKVRGQTLYTSTSKVEKWNRGEKRIRFIPNARYFCHYLFPPPNLQN